MLRSILATGGYAAELEALKGRTFSFPDTGLVILFGPNGCGKSTVLKLLAAYSGTEGGWTTFSSDYLDNWMNKEEAARPFPARFAQARSAAKCTADVVWDGTPTYFSSGPAGRSQESFNAALEAGGDECKDYFRKVFRPGSSGQEQIAWLMNMEKVLAGSPDLLEEDRGWNISGQGKVKASRVNDSWSSAINRFVEYVRSLPRDGSMTVLLDEPDAHMSIPNQQVLWAKALPRLAVGRQVIVATHSPFALSAPGATLVDLKEFGAVPRGRGDAGRRSPVMFPIRVYRSGRAAFTGFLEGGVSFFLGAALAKLGAVELPVVALISVAALISVVRSLLVAFWLPPAPGESP